MHFLLCKSVKPCTSLVRTDKRRSSRQEVLTQVKGEAMPSLLKQLQYARSADRVEAKSQEKDVSRSSNRRNRGAGASSSSKARVDVHLEFIQATALSSGTIFTDHESLPSLVAAFSRFKGMYPRYSETTAIDTLRATEYAHLDEFGRVCLDYCGFGLFSHLQQLQDWESASFLLTDVSVNLCSHALCGAAEPGTVECDIRKRIMDYLNIQDTEYSMVFTTSRGASFKLLADAYPFETCRQLVTMYDYESESVGWLVKRAKEKGVKVYNASFKWSSLRIVSTKLKQLLIGKRRGRGQVKGLFVFPVQSRVSGAKYSYQWMSLAQQNKWHVLLDASALGPKDMDSLGLSLFRPDFIIASFYKVFGADPSGFGCLFIKNSAIQCIQDESGAPATGIVRIIPYPNEWYVSCSSEANSEEPNEFIDAEFDKQEAPDFEFHQSNLVIASFSGPMLGLSRRSENGTDKLPRIEGVVEEEYDNDDSSVGESIGEVTRSPVFSEDGTDNLFCIDIGPSPVGTSRTSMSEDPFSGPFSGPFSRGKGLPLSTELHKEEGRGLDNRHCTAMAQCSVQGSKNAVPEDHCDLGDFDPQCQQVASSKATGELKKDTQQMVLLDTGKSPCLGHGIQVDGEDTDVNTKQVCKCELQGSKSEILCSEGFQMSSFNMKHDLRTNEIEECVDAEEESASKNSSLQTLVFSDQMNLDAKGKAIEKADWNQNESAIRRETEGDYRLLGRRTGMIGMSLSPILQDSDDLSLNVDIEHRAGGYMKDNEKGSISYENNASDNHEDEQEQGGQKEPEVLCRSLDHVDMLGLNKTTLRLRYLINWLISSLLQLHHPGQEVNVNAALVHIYGPQIKYDRGASVAFNVYDCHGKLVHPEVVQMLADRSNISLSIGFLWNIHIPDSNNMLPFLENQQHVSTEKASHGKRTPTRIEVVTAALNILTNFEDVYRLWVFVAQFLDADFVPKEFGAQAVLEDTLL